uniref:Synaptotagmin-like protein 2 n=1 Tax=Paramormyrops kingsleyae TaxID=1676925 RepID=A0A3B3T3D9_9TELE
GRYQGLQDQHGLWGPPAAPPGAPCRASEGLIMIDLSYLTEEEREMILMVLKRDADLKKAEEYRVRWKLQDNSQLKFLTGQWFYEVRSHRHRIQGSEIIRASLRRRKFPEKPREFPENKDQPLLISLLDEEQEVGSSPLGETKIATSESPQWLSRDDGQGKKTLAQASVDEVLESQSIIILEDKRTPIKPARWNLRSLDERTNAPQKSPVIYLEKLQQQEKQPDSPVDVLKYEKNQSQVSESVVSLYSGDLTLVEVRGTIQFSISYEQKLKELHIFIVQCGDLAVADQKKNRTDPYVKSYLLPDKAKMRKRKTSVKKKTLNPTFNELLRVRVSLCSAITLTYIQVSNSGEVHIWVKECKNLPIIRGSTSDMGFCSFIFPDTSRKSRQKTRVLRRTPNPVFNHTMVIDGFREGDLLEACAELTVWDHDRLSNHFLGGLRLSLGSGKSYESVVDWMDSSADESKLWKRMMESPSEWVEGTLPLRVVTPVKHTWKK